MLVNYLNDSILILLKKVVSNSRLKESRVPYKKCERHPIERSIMTHFLCSESIILPKFLVQQTGPLCTISISRN